MTEPTSEKHGPNKGSARRGFGRIRRERSGRYSAAYVGPDVQLHRGPTTFQTRLDAEGWLTDERRLIEHGAWASPSARAEAKQERERRVKREAVTVSEYFTGWLAGRALRPRTVSDYRTLYTRHLDPTFGAIPIREVTKAGVKAWYARFNPDTPRERAKAYSLFKTVLNGAVEDELIPTNPAGIRGAGAPSRPKNLDPPSLTQLADLTAAMPERLQLAVLLGAWCALRYGEVAELRRQDIDLQRGRIRIQRGVTWVKGDATVGRPKTRAGHRDVAVPPHLLPVLEAHLAEHTGEAFDSLLFPAVRSRGHIWPATFHRHFSKARAAAGRPDLRFHDLRHTGAVLAAATGATLAELMARLGHTTAGAAMRYQHAAKDRDQQIAEALSRMAATLPS